MARKVLITGASSGIGYELCHVFAENGFDVVGVARNRGILEMMNNAWCSLYKTKFEFLVCDLSDSGDLLNLFDYLKKETVDVLINNAGIGLYGKFNSTDIQRNLDIIDVNMIALTKLTYHFLKNSEVKHKTVINISSIAGFYPGVGSSVYFASKSYVNSFSQAVAIENEGVHRVICICPGDTATNFFENAGGNVHQNAADPRGVAKLVYDSYAKNASLKIVGIKNKILFSLLKILPAFLVRKYSKYRHIFKKIW
ncbi:MAG: SDR family NAD(P)-dependent oxidoreductase [Candidatus Dojkabacteria bacterium]|nr:SDR family NAD(P)-dependent oxidoreductase [Candidatus Dojkabacteria bacterium]